MLDAALTAAQPWLASAFVLWGSPVTWAEVAAFVLSLAMVVCNINVNPMGWPLAIGSSLLYALLFAHYRLYGEASLQLLFIALSCWGWWQWLRGRSQDGMPLAVRTLSLRSRGIALAATLAAWPLLGWGLQRASDSDVPYFDALPTVGSIAGQILLGRKWIENWPVWIAVNLVSMALFAYKDLWLTVILYALFAAMSVWGWRRWQALQAGAGHAAMG